MRWMFPLLPFAVWLQFAQASLFDHEEALGMACAIAARELFTACNEEEYRCFCGDTLYVFSVENCIGREAKYNSTTMGIAYDKFRYSFCESHGVQVNSTDVWSAENQSQDPQVSGKAFRLAYEGERNNMSQKTISVWLGIGMILYWALISVIVTMVEWIRQFILRLVQYRVIMKRPSRVERWFQKHVLLPALFGTRHMRRYEFLRGWVVFTTPTRFETIVVAGYFTLGLIFMLTPYTFMNSDPLFGTRWKEMMRYSSDRAGIIATVQFPLLVLFALRNNVFIWLTGWSYSTFQTYHRAVARITYLLLIIHAILKHIFSASYGGSLVKYYYPVPYFRWGCAAIGLLTLMIMSAALRARGYEVFYRLHQAFALSGIICTHYHLNGIGFKSPLWITFALWGADWLVRVFRILLFNVNFILPPLPGARQSTFATMRLYDGQVIRISVVTPVRWKCNAGQYIYLHTNQFSFIGGHPFSVLGPSAYGEGLEIMVKAREGMTRKLCAKLAERGCTPEYPVTIPVFVEGPYGVSAPVDRYEQGLMFAGGIGITGVLGYMEKMISSNRPGEFPKKIKLFWAIRMQSDIEPVMHRLTKFVSIEGVEIHIFMHQRKGQPALTGPDNSSTESAEKKTDLTVETVSGNESAFATRSDPESVSETPHAESAESTRPHSQVRFVAPRRASQHPQSEKKSRNHSARHNQSGETSRAEGNREYDDEIPDLERGDKRNSRRHSIRMSTHSAIKQLVPRHHGRTKSELAQLRRSVVNFVKARNPDEEDEDDFDYGRENFEENRDNESEHSITDHVENSRTKSSRAAAEDEQERYTAAHPRHENSHFIDAGFTDRFTRRMTMLNPFDDRSYPIHEPSAIAQPFVGNQEAEALIQSSVQLIGMDIVSIIREEFQQADGSVCIVGCGPDRMVDTLGWATSQFLELAEYGRVDYFEEAFRW